MAKLKIQCNTYDRKTLKHIGTNQIDTIEINEDYYLPLAELIYIRMKNDLKNIQMKIKI